MDRPSNMNSKDIWRQIMGSNIPSGSFFINEEKLLESIRQEKINKRMDLIGEQCGIFVVLAIYAVVFCIISYMFTPLKYYKCLGISVGLFCASKVMSIPMMRFLKKTVKQTLNG